MSKPPPPPASRNTVPQNDLPSSHTGVNHYAAASSMNDIVSSTTDLDKPGRRLEHLPTLVPQSQRWDRDDPITNILPPELSSLIFEHYVKGEKEAMRCCYNLPRRIPFKLGAVCQSWRRIAWATPSLWTTIRVSLRAEGHPAAAELYREWFRRTNGFPLEVSVDVDIYIRKRWVNFNDSTTAARAVVDILLEYMRQVRWLNLRLVPFEVISLLRTENLPGQPAALSRLELGNIEENISQNKADDAAFKVFAGLNPPPSPRYLSLSSSISPQVFNMSWDSLTTVTLEYTSRMVAFQIIALSASSLRELDLRAVDGYKDSDNRWHPTQLVDVPNLRTLFYNNIDASDGVTNGLFEYFNFHHLESFKYWGDIDDTNYLPTETMISCIRRSSCRLTTLVLECAELRDMPALVALLRATSDLTTLDITLDTVHPAEPLIKALHDGNRTSQAFLPHLRMLKLDADSTSTLR